MEPDQKSPSIPVISQNHCEFSLFDALDKRFGVENVDASYSVESHDKASYVRTTTAVKMPREYSEDSLVYVRESSLRRARSLLDSMTSKKPFTLDEILFGVGSVCIGVVLGAVRWDGEPLAIVNSLFSEIQSLPGIIAVVTLLSAAFLRRDSVKDEGNNAERVLECLTDPDDCVEGAEDEH